MNRVRTMTWSVTLLAVIFIVAPGAGWLSEAKAQVVLPDPKLPPEPDPPDCDNLISLYAGQDLFATFTSTAVYTMSDVRHRCFTNVFRQIIGSDELEDFDSIWDATMDFGSGPVAVSLTGPVQTMTYGKASNTTGTFDAEIVSMSLSGSAGVYNLELRESPTLISTGSTTITDLGGGLYQIDSFFDVFTELSVDGGNSWLPVDQSGRLILVPAATVATATTSWGAIKNLYNQ